MIKVKNLYKSFGSKIVLENLNFSIQSGSMVAIVGDSGSGKTTLLNILGGIESVTQGTVEVNGRNIVSMKYREQQHYLKNDISFLFQSYALMEDKNVYENISLVPSNDRLLNSRDGHDKVLKSVGLEGYGKRIVGTLSGGEQQRVALARIMIKPSSIILADEPTGNLDSHNAEIVLNIFKEINKMGKTIIVVTHDESLLFHFNNVIGI